MWGVMGRGGRRMIRVGSELVRGANAEGAGIEQGRRKNGRESVCVCVREGAGGGCGKMYMHTRMLVHVYRYHACAHALACGCARTVCAYAWCVTDRACAHWMCNRVVVFVFFFVLVRALVARNE